MDEMYQFVAVLDATGTLLEVNRAALEGAGLSDVEGKPFWECFWWTVSTEIQAALRQAIVRASDGEFVRYDVEIYGRAHGKETIVIDFSMIPVKDETGKVVFIVPEGRDITAKKAQEREIAQKNTDLQALLERIKELDEIKTQFFANVSHELRTPLALIIGPAQRLMDESRTMETSELRESAGVIARNARILLKHVTDLLDLSKLEAGKLKIELQDANVSSLVRVMASHFDVLAQQRSIDYRVEARDGVVCAIDPEKFERVLMNLLSNAFKFVPDGGRIRCALEVTDQEVVLAVHDSGPGVAPEFRRLIFERFRQGEGGASREFGGTGLGLAIAKEFVEMHRGKLEVKGSSLGGAMFQMTLPNHRLHPEQTLRSEPKLDGGLITGILEELRPSSSPPQEIGPTEPGALKTTLLLVEDNIDMNRFIMRCLGEQYEVISAMNGQEGLAKALALRPSIIVSDIMMPVMSGAAMIAEIRKRPELADIPILVLSAKADEDLKVQLLDGGAQDFVAKPFSEKDLLVRVRNLVSVRDARLESARARAVAVEARSRLHAQFMQAPVAVCILTGPDFVYALANPLYLEMVGRKDIVGKPIRTVFPEFPPDASVIEMLERVFSSGEPFAAEEYRMVLDREGRGVLEPAYFRFSAQPVRDATGRVTDIMLVAVDVTGQVHARRRIESLMEELKLKDQRKNEFLAMLAHELRNPLAALTTAQHIIASDGATDPRLLGLRATSMRQVQHLVRLVDDLLDVARITEGKIDLRRERVDLATVLRDALQETRAQIDARGQDVSIVLRAGPFWVEGDPTRLEQIFNNLLVNASKYTDHGGRIAVRCTSEQRGDTAWVVVEIEDTGQGLAPAMVEQVFNLFTQVDASLDRAGGGLGIGLTLVRRLLELQGGTVQARSEGQGRGSTFTVRLPLAAAPVDVPAARPRPSRDSSINRRVVVVEDNEDVREVMKVLLESWGHEVEAAADGVAGIALILSSLPDIAFIDVGLPGLDGFQVAQSVRASPQGAKTLLVALTGYGDAAMRARALAAGFDHHLVKPVRPEHLEQVLASRSFQTD